MTGLYLVDSAVPRYLYRYRVDSLFVAASLFVFAGRQRILLLLWLGALPFNLASFFFTNTCRLRSYTASSSRRLHRIPLYYVRGSPAFGCLRSLCADLQPDNLSWYTRRRHRSYIDCNFHRISLSIFWFVGSPAFSVSLAVTAMTFNLATFLCSRCRLRSHA